MHGSPPPPAAGHPWDHDAYFVRQPDCSVLAAVLMLAGAVLAIAIPLATVALTVLETL